AEEITCGHATAGGRPGPWGERAFGHGSPWEKLYEHNALYCFLGVTYRVHTLRHFIQSLLLEETLSVARTRASLEAARTNEGDAAAAGADKLRAQAAGWNKPGVFPWWNGEQEEEALAARGLIRYVQIGNATCRSIPARTDVDTLLGLIREAPEEWLNPEFLPWYLRGVR
ncbi:MAG: AAC(3) family N-acetyltransferase, partial [Armatimonadetes bacterium]|nr:AAC(3) family N-acetyltransferase [Armatimonadota bacterium]